MKELQAILNNEMRGLTLVQEEMMLKCLKMAYNKGVTDSAESVRTDRGKTHNDCGECGYTEIDKQSILKNIIP